MRADDIRQARMNGAWRAAKELRRLKVDQSHAIDIYRVILDANLWLLFQPLDDLLGVYVPEGDGGVLVNTRRPQSVQRLTAAHEYAHHVLDHQVSLDDMTDIEDPNASRRVEEAAASAFASDFLMPPQLVNELWNELKLPDEIGPPHAYLLALHMGTSYQATIHQLGALKKIPEYRAQELLRVTPKQIKQQIGHGLSPGNPWAEVWPVEEAQAGRSIKVAVEDEISVSLSEIPSTGFIWVPDMDDLTDHGDAEPSVALIKNEHDPVDHSSLADQTGARGHRYMTFRALKAGGCKLCISLQRPWQKPSEPAKVFDLEVQIRSKPTGDADRGYYDETKTTDLAIRGRAA